MIINTKLRISTYTNVAGTQTEVFPIAIEHDNIEANAPVQLKSIEQYRQKRTNKLEKRSVNLQHRH